MESCWSRENYLHPLEDRAEVFEMQEGRWLSRGPWRAQGITRVLTIGYSGTSTTPIEVTHPPIPR